MKSSGQSALRHLTKCLVCKADQKNSFGHEVSQIFYGGNAHSVSLCWNHSLELFKGGQELFLGRYGANLPRPVAKHEEY